VSGGFISRTTGMQKSQIDSVVENYLRGNDDERYSAWETITELLAEQPNEAWRLIRAVLRAATNDHDLGRIGAGPLEELFVYHGDDLRDELVAEASENPNFLRAYTAMYFNDMPEQVIKAVDDALSARGTPPPSRERRR
jgi:hypothetical protein